MRFAIKLSLAALAAGSVMSGAAQAASAEKGKEMFVQHGCWQCHGFVGQGGITGPKLGPDPLPLDSLSAFIRSSNGPMPPDRKSTRLNSSHSQQSRMPSSA